jgi:IMP dehydrogenase/GMP reductase
MELIFFGAGAANTTFDALVIGWNELRNGTVNVWVPVPITHFTCTLGTAVGVASADVAATDQLADTVIVAANGGIGVIASQVAGDRIAKVEVGVEGYRKVEVIFDMTGATNGNCLYRAY